VPNIETPTELARRELVPLLGSLCEVAQADGAKDQEAFFARVQQMIEVSAEAEDLAGPMMELSTSAFLGFEYSPVAAILLDEVLAISQTIAATLSAPGGEAN